MPGLYKARRAVVWVDSEPALMVQARAVQLLVRAELELAHPAWCNPLWELAQPYLRMILQSSRRWERSTKQLHLPTNAFMECRYCSSIRGRRISALPKPLLRDRVSLSRSTTTAR